MSAAERLQQGALRGLMRLLGAWERLESGAAWDPMNPRFVADPYSSYRHMREHDPIHRSRLSGGLVFVRYDDVLALLGERRLSSDLRSLAFWPRMKKAWIKAGRNAEDLERPTMLNSDPPRHTRLRALVNRAFTPRAVQRLEARVEQVVAGLLEDKPRGTTFDVIADLAGPLPVRIIAEMLGIPAEHHQQFKHWSDMIVLGLGLGSLDELRQSTAGMRELNAYLEPIAVALRREPGDNLLSALLAAEEQGDRLTMDEVFSMVRVLLVAGNETTTKMIGNGLLALLRNPEQLRLLREQPQLMDSAVEELLRYEGPAHAALRAALEDFEYRGTRIHKKQTVILGLAAANRDPARFVDPERLDVTRQDNPHLAFGHSIHFCIGAALARLEIKAALRALIARYPDLRLADERPRWGAMTPLRGLECLPVHV